MLAKSELCGFPAVVASGAIKCYALVAMVLVAPHVASVAAFLVADLDLGMLRMSGDRIGQLVVAAASVVQLSLFGLKAALCFLFLRRARETWSDSAFAQAAFILVVGGIGNLGWLSLMDLHTAHPM